ncbi:hypothetical protein PMIN04_009979 [Paraphaeosphaeria minitans]
MSCSSLWVLVRGSCAKEHRRATRLLTSVKQRSRHCRRRHGYAAAAHAVRMQPSHTVQDSGSYTTTPNIDSLDMGSLHTSLPLRMSDGLPRAPLQARITRPGTPHTQSIGPRSHPLLRGIFFFFASLSRSDDDGRMCRYETGGRLMIATLAMWQEADNTYLAALTWAFKTRCRPHRLPTAVLRWEQGCGIWAQGCWDRAIGVLSVSAHPLLAYDAYLVPTWYLPSIYLVPTWYLPCTYLPYLSTYRPTVPLYRTDGARGQRLVYRDCFRTLQMGVTGACQRQTMLAARRPSD